MRNIYRGGIGSTIEYLIDKTLGEGFKVTRCYLTFMSSCFISS